MLRVRVGFALILIAIVLLIVSSKVGGVHIVSNGSTLTYKENVASTIVGFCAGACLLILAVMIATARIGLRRLFAVVALFLGFFACLISYSTIQDYVMIGEKSLVLSPVGFQPNHVTINYDELEEVVFLSKQSDIEFHKNDQSRVTIPMGDLVQASLPQIKAALRSHDIPQVTE
jgi:hypothetical protein